MHPNPTFRTEPETRNLAFAAERGFGTLCLAAAPYPLLAHVPFRLDVAGRRAELHLMRSNPVARALSEGEQAATLAVAGPDGYVSPDWYETPDQVPTWNYVSVHLQGRLSRLPDAALRPLLDGLSAHFERELAPKRPWTADKMSPGTMERMMRSLVPVAFAVEAVHGTWKLGQNKPEAARNGAAAGIDAYGIGQETAILAALMRGIPA